MATIYALMEGNLCLYVGRTIDMKRRYQQHKRGASGSEDFPKGTKWNMVVLEECKNEDRTFRERFHYDRLMPLYNRKSPGLTFEEKQYQQYGIQIASD